MAKKEIHIWELPPYKTYIKLKEPYRNNLFRKAYKETGNWNKLGKKLGVKRPDTLIAKNWKDGECSFPLGIAIKICNITKSSKYNLEKNLLEIRYKEKLNKRGGNSGKPLKNPKFPIKIDKKFVEIIGHICGDGAIPKSKQRTGIPLCYINSQIELIEHFKRLVNSVFGDITPTIFIRDDKKHYKRPNYYLKYPTILSIMILKVFNGKQEPLKFPSYLTKTKENKIHFLKAIYDDEGNIDHWHKRIALGMKSEQFIEGCKRTLKELGIETGKTYKVKNKEFFKVYIPKEINIRKFIKLIKLKHPLKRKLLTKVMKEGWKFERYDNHIPREKIITLLKEKDMKINEISKKLNRKPETIKDHLNNLEKEGLIRYYTNINNELRIKNTHKIWQYIKNE